MSRPIPKLIELAFERDPSMRLMLRLLVCSTEDLARIRKDLTTTLRSLQYQAPQAEWEEVSYWDLKACCEELARAFAVIDDARTKLERRCLARWKTEAEHDRILNTARGR